MVAFSSFSTQMAASRWYIKGGISPANGWSLGDRKYLGTSPITSSEFYKEILDKINWKRICISPNAGCSPLVICRMLKSKVAILFPFLACQILLVYLQCARRWPSSIPIHSKKMLQGLYLQLYKKQRDACRIGQICLSSNWRECYLFSFWSNEPKETIKYQPRGSGKKCILFQMKQKCIGRINLKFCHGRLRFSQTSWWNRKQSFDGVKKIAFASEFLIQFNV